MEITRPNQVWVSDITYIRTIKGFCYLALITDMHSRKIVGYDLSDSLELKGCVRALNKASLPTFKLALIKSSFSDFSSLRTPSLGRDLRLLLTISIICCSIFRRLSALDLYL